jgi:hypothetical protein
MRIAMRGSIFAAGAAGGERCHEPEWTGSLIMRGGQHTRSRGKARFARASNPTPHDTICHDPKLWVATGEPRVGQGPPGRHQAGKPLSKPLSKSSRKPSRKPSRMVLPKPSRMPFERATARHHRAGGRSCEGRSNDHRQPDASKLGQFCIDRAIDPWRLQNCL